MTICVYCGNSFEAKKHANGIKKKYCSKVCKVRQNLLNTMNRKKGK